MLTCTYTHDEMHEHSHTNKSIKFMKEQMFVLLYNGEIKYVTDTLPFLNNIFLCFQNCIFNSGGMYNLSTNQCTFAKQPMAI